MSNHYVVEGPPGCGKTYWTARQVERAIEAHGSDSVLVCSLTRAAAREAGGRIPLPKHQVGTLHSIVYRALNYPDIAESKVKDWNESHTDMELSGAANADENGGGSKNGDALYQEYTLRRAKCQPPETWRAEIQYFARAWDKWKLENNLMDFTDVIESGITNVPMAPNDAKIIFMDEAQDASLLELRLLQRWQRHAERMITIGDAAQAIFTFRGAAPEQLLPRDIPADNHKILSQSYRVPERVRQCAVTWYSESPCYRPTEYRARRDDGGKTVQGSVETSNATYKDAAAIIDQLLCSFEAGRTVMVQASCGFFLDPLIAKLRSQGIPFANPWRITNGRWNPLAPRAGISATDRLLAFLKPQIKDQFWTGADFKAWAEVLKSSNCLLRGAKKTINALDDDAGSHQIIEVLQQCFTENARAAIANVNLEWWLDNLLKDKRAALDFPLSVYRRYGANALAEQPRIIVGTIHSLKGSEADDVILFPDLSHQGFLNWSNDPSQIYRQFYVGITRARDTLTVCTPGSHRFVELPV